MLRAGFWVCVVIALAAVARRSFALFAGDGSSASGLAALDATFVSHRALTLAHILPAATFVLLAPWALSRRFGSRPLLERAFFGLGLVVGATAYAMSRYAVGGWVEQSAVLVFNTLFLTLLGMALARWRKGCLEEARRWLTGAVAVLLGIATTRPVVGLFFATSRLTHFTPAQFFGVAFWIGFGVNTLIIAVWLRSVSGARKAVES